MVRITAVLGIVLVAIICYCAEKDLERGAGVDARSPAKVLFDELRVMDGKLFDAVFGNCDAEAVKRLVTEDFEFLHDRGGQVATNAAQFVENIRRMCERQKTGEEARSRRELVRGSVEVFPLNNYGAIQTGMHRFYVLKEGQPERAGDMARFTHVWKKVGAEWRIARVLSYDHKLAE